MTVKITKPALNLREELNKLDKPSGITGESLLRADTAADAKKTLGIDNFEQVSVSTDGVISADGLNLGDSDKIQLGNSNDLQIYHNGNHSFLQDSGTGSLYIQAADNVFIDHYGGTGRIATLAGGGVQIKYDGVTKLQSTNTGIDVTGTVISDGLDVDGTIKLDGNYPVGSFNVALGNSALDSLTTGDNSVAIGNSALTAATTAGYNVAVGRNALVATTSGGSNVSIGGTSMTANTTGAQNVAVGRNALMSSVSANNNVGIGFSALQSSTTGHSNIAIGMQSGDAITTAIESTLVGHQTGSGLTTGHYNTAFGFRALFSAQTITKATAIGYRALYSATGGTNTAIGHDALRVNTTGGQNTAVGYQTLDANTTGQYGTALGHNTLTANTTGSRNTGLGTNALASNVTGSENTAVGYDALTSATGGNNTAVGKDSLRSLTTGSNSVSVGHSALKNVTTGNSNVALGSQAGQQLTTGSFNVAIGRDALLAATTDGNNIAMGYRALLSLTGSAGENLAFGYESQRDNVTGNSNVSMGNGALYKNTTGDRNVAIGHQALRDLNITNNSDSYNTAVGFQAGAKLTTGHSNTIFGAGALDELTTQTKNTVLGSQACSNKTDGDAGIYIGVQAGRSDNGDDNIAIGEETLRSNSSGAGGNIAMGHDALYNLNTTGSTYNIAIGYGSGRALTTANKVTLLGALAGDALTTGGSNTMLGYNSGTVVTTGYNNTFVGQGAGSTITTASNNTILGRYSGNQGGLDIRTSNNHIVLSDGAGNPRVVVDSSGNTGIGTVSPDRLLHLNTGTTGAITPLLRLEGSFTSNTGNEGTAIEFITGSGGTEVGARIIASREAAGARGALRFCTGRENDAGFDDGNVVIDESGNLLVGTTTVLNSSRATFDQGYGAAATFNRRSSDGAIAYFSKDSTAVGSILSVGGSDIKVVFSNDGDQYITGNGAGNYLTFSTGNGERGRFDNSGKFMVGTSQSNVYNSSSAQGSIVANDHIQVARSGGVAAYFNRNTSDGPIIELRRAGANKGSIGVRNSQPYIDNGSNSIQFNPTDIRPRTQAAGSNLDATIDLGEANARFRHLYISGDANIGDLKGTNDGDTRVRFLGSDRLAFNTGGLEAARFDASQNFIVGSTVTGVSSDGARLMSDGHARFTTDGGTALYLNRRTSGGSIIEFRKDNTGVGSVSVSNTATAYNTSSDERLKENIADADDAGAVVDAIQVRKFDWIVDGEHQRYGMVAQELNTVAPEAVTEGKTEDDMMSVDYSKLVPMLIKEIQSLRARVAQLEGAN